MAAAEMVGRLLERYALSMQEIDVRQEVCVQIEVPVGGKQRRPIDGCVTAIARFCDCKVWVSRDTGKPNYVFFGFAVCSATGRMSGERQQRWPVAACEEDGVTEASRQGPRCGNVTWTKR
jgi:hypothetical protein